MQRRWAKQRRDVLVDLANLRDDGLTQFRSRNRFFLHDPRLADNSAILQYRDQLQQIWRGEDAGTILSTWINYCRMGHLPMWSVPTWADGTHTVEPNYTLFQLSLAIAAGEWMPRMAICGNLDCPQRYFLKGRKTQRFCDRPGCTAYGQREHKRKWWAEHGADWKQKHERIQKSPKSNRRKGGR